MVAIDASVLVRLLTADHAAQFRAARALFSRSDIYIPVTVVLEAEWVLRAAYELPPPAVCSALRSVMGLDNVRVAESTAVVQALVWHEEGVDFADALHLALSQSEDSFKTFDASLVKQAQGRSPVRVEKP